MKDNKHVIELERSLTRLKERIERNEKNFNGYSIIAQFKDGDYYMDYYAASDLEIPNLLGLMCSMMNLCCTSFNEQHEFLDMKNGESDPFDGSSSPPSTLQ